MESRGGRDRRNSQTRKGDIVSTKPDWRGVFPAVTTQFRRDFSVDYEATERVIARLVDEGVNGLVVCGTVGENTSLTREERVGVMQAARSAAQRRVPVIAGIAEMSTQSACDMAKEARRADVDGVMVMPALVYSAKPRESAAHFRAVAGAMDLPVMVYNNPPIYKADVTPEILATLADCETIVCIKESSGDTRRFTDIRNMTGDRFMLFAGLDDTIVESVLLGAQGWVSGMSNVFPKQGNRLFELAAAGKTEELRALYDWFMPLLHLDARPDLVQCIKLCEQIAGRGTELTRPPRLQLEGAERAFVERLMANAREKRPPD
jgi:4-hydroxy-tetrahydrodipicolinate synthase